MKKVLLFLVLLGAGLLLLYWLDRRTTKELLPEPEQSPPPALLPEVEQGLQLGGPSQLTGYDEETKRPVLRVESENTRTEGGFDLMTGVTLELFDPKADGVVQLRLRAERVRARRMESEDSLQPSWEDRLELEGVHADILSGMALAPLTFETASAIIDLTDPSARRILTEAAFVAHSQEAVIEGTGFEWSPDNERLEVRRNGRVEIRQPNAPPISFTAQGEGRMELRQAQEGIALEAWDGVLLDFGDSETGRLEARHVTLLARHASKADEPLVLERLEAEGSVDWVSGDTRFQGQRLEAGFSPDGSLDEARLAGDPRAELALVLSPDVLPAADEPRERLVVVEGPEAIVITRRDGGYDISVERASGVVDPSNPPEVPSVVSRDFRLESADTIRGWLSSDQRSARFEASGGVIVTGGEATLETANFVVEIGTDQSGETILVGTASGGARLEGSLPVEPGSPLPARTFTLTSPDGLQIERSPSGWRVVESTRVEITLAEPDGFRASAGRVSNFVVPRSSSGLSPEGMRFLAQGEVRVEFAGGSFGGEELEVMSVAPVPHLIMRGTPESKAFFVSEFGEATALEVERTGDTLEARGDVSGTAVLSGRDTLDQVTYSFAGDALSLERTEGPELIRGERLRTLRLQVEGSFEGSVTAKDQTLVARGERFSAENRVRLVEGSEEPLELGSLFVAEGAVHADFLQEDSELSIDSDRLEMERTASDVEAGFRTLTADGNVHFGARITGNDEFDISGDCELLVFDADRRGSMEAGPHGRVTLSGREPERNLPFRLTGGRVDFELTQQGVFHLLATEPELRMLGLRARARHFTADDQRGVVLSGDVRMSGTTTSHVPFTLGADNIRLVGRRQADDGREDLGDELDELQATGAIDFRLSDSLRARGERLTLRRATGLLRLEGVPARFDMGSTRLEAEWVEFDPVLEVLVSTGPGRMLTQEKPDAPLTPDAWTLDFLSASTLLDLDSVVLVIQEPFFHTAQNQSALRASWAIMWLNREAFQDSSRRDELMLGLQEALSGLKEMSQEAGIGQMLSLFRSAEMSGFLREVYFEGPVEVLAEGKLLARSDAIYLDTASQHGWLAGATVNLGGQLLSSQREKLIVKADWLRISSDGSLRADQATVTSCDFDDPHVRVVTGDLRIEPFSESGKEQYRLLLKENRIELYDKLRIPLPTIDLSTDEELKPIWPSLSLGNSARFGTLFSLAVTRPADAVGRFFDRYARSGDSKGDKDRGSRSDVDAHYKLDGSYLGSRGALLDLGLEIEAKEDYWFDLYLGLALDSGEDRGFIRVDEDDRDSLRTWVRSQAYFDLGKSAWSLSYSNQSDAAVQSEFYESQFLLYERAENYVQWRRSSNENFIQGSVKIRTEDFRTDIEELPSVSAYRGRSPLMRFGNVALLYTADARAEYLRRRVGDGPRSPFEPLPTFGDPISAGGFGGLDGLGDREVLRADTTQRLELPVPLGAGWKLTPFVSARATAWSEGVEGKEDPTRFVSEGGARLSASFWKRTKSGKLHQVAPFVEYRSELRREERNGTPVVFDEVDQFLSGDFVSFGSRARLGKSGASSALDLDLVGTHASSRSDGQPDGWLPLEVYARVLLQPYGHEFEVYHDARYDLENHRTKYSLISLGTRLGQEWGLQLSHQRGLDVNNRALFETASVAGLYRWTEKWEFEGRQSFSLLEDEGLDTKIILRRYAHDLVLEIETSVREGEGSSFGISVKPRFGYRPPHVGYVAW